MVAVCLRFSGFVWVSVFGSKTNGVWFSCRLYQCEEENEEISEKVVVKK